MIEAFSFTSPPPTKVTCLQTCWISTQRVSLFNIQPVDLVVHDAAVNAIRCGRDVLLYDGTCVCHRSENAAPTFSNVDAVTQQQQQPSNRENITVDNQTFD